MSEQKTRHILSLSGGKDSTALAIYMRDRESDLEYVFCDTEKELPETYEYLGRLEAYLGQPIVRLKHDGRGFDHLLTIRNGFLPSPRNRWCTEYLKLKPFERFVGQEHVVNFIGIRADEAREGYISHKPNITAKYPFKEAGLVKADVVRLLDLSGLGMPEYYKWRSRSGCYFCFYQQKIEWVGLLANHPDLYECAKAYERTSDGLYCRYTWAQNESLEDLARPERVEQIRKEHAHRLALEIERKPNMRLVEIYEDLVAGNEFEEKGCLICEL